MQEDYYRRSPYNAVRITLSMEKRGNPDTDYALAGSTFSQWLHHGVLIRDPEPAFYIYYQEYAYEGTSYLRKGFIGLLDLEDAASGVIPHESTLSAPKEDRLRLMRSLEANDDLIYMLYNDKERAVAKVLDAGASGRSPEIEVEDDYGTIHRLWILSDPDSLRTIRDAMAPQSLFIADGHHRFETAVRFMKECRERNWKPAAAESFDKRMVTCFNAADGVTILPTHRLLRDLPGWDADSFLKAVRRTFSVERASSAEDLWGKMKEARGEKMFGFRPASPGCFYLLRMKPQALQDPLLERHGKALRSLDVTILHTLLLERLLGIDAARLESQVHIDYERDREACIRLVDEGRYQAAFFLNPTTIEQLLEIAALGMRMPQKSTDFYPKLLTGLVFMKMEILK